MTPPANRLLPPASASGAHSRTTTLAPCSRADRAAQSAALPAPTTMTSCSGLSIALEAKEPSLVQPDLLVEDLPLGVVDVILHPRLGDLVERRARDRIPVELVGREFLELPGDGLALRGVHLARVAGVVIVDLGVGVARGVPCRGAVREEGVIVGGELEIGRAEGREGG